MSDPLRVYLDNNATTMAPPEVIDTVVRWMNRGHPSAGYASAREAQKLLQGFRRRLAADGGFELEGPLGYTVLFTSGGSEGNCHIATAAARAYAACTKKLPHLILSAIEHQSMLACCRQLVRDRMAQLTLLPVRTCGSGSGGTGTVDPEELRKAIRPNTCLISIMAANNETGALNDLRSLGAIARAASIPFHSDAVQLFGRATVRPTVLNLDAFTGSFHKLHGPVGVGFLAIRTCFVDGYGLGALVGGSQNGGLRGGVENLPGIAGAFAAYKRAALSRGDKNRQMRRLRDGMMVTLSRRFLAVHVDDYCEARPRAPDGDTSTPRSSRVPTAPRTKAGAALALRLDTAAAEGRPVLVWIAPADRARILPNTLLFSTLRAAPGGFCNKKARAALERRGVLVGIGSAGDAAAGGPSHVIEALDVPPALWQGVLRVSLSDDTSAADVAAFVGAFAAVASSSEALLD